MRRDTKTRLASLIATKINTGRKGTMSIPRTHILTSSIVFVPHAVALICLSTKSRETRDSRVIQQPNGSVSQGAREL
jgi:hypothetical protein